MKLQIHKCHFVHILRQLLFFSLFQGNSNSLSTVDVGASFTGVSSFSPIPVTALTFLNTYGAQAAAMLFCMATASSSENGGAATALLVRVF